MVGTSGKVFLCNREHSLGVVVSTCDACSSHLSSMRSSFELKVAEQKDESTWVFDDTMIGELTLESILSLDFCYVIKPYYSSNFYKNLGTVFFDAFHLRSAQMLPSLEDPLQHYVK